MICSSNVSPPHDAHLSDVLRERRRQVPSALDCRIPGEPGMVCRAHFVAGESNPLAPLPSARPVVPFPASRISASMRKSAYLLKKALADIAVGHPCAKPVAAGAFQISCFCALRGPRGPTGIPCPPIWTPTESHSRSFHPSRKSQPLSRHCGLPREFGPGPTSQLTLELEPAIRTARLSRWGINARL